MPVKPINENFSKSKILHESSKLEHFQWGGGGVVKILGYKCRGGIKKFWTSHKFRFPTIIIFICFGPGIKIHQITLKSMVISADIFVVILRYF